MSWSRVLVKLFPLLSQKHLLVFRVLHYTSCLCLFPTCFLCVLIYLLKSMFFFHSLSVHLFQSSCLFFVSCTLRWLLGVLCVPAFIPCGFCVYSQFMYFPFVVGFSLTSFYSLPFCCQTLCCLRLDFWMLALLIKLTCSCIRVVFRKNMTHWTDAEKYTLCNVFAFVNQFLPCIL